MKHEEQGAATSGQLSDPGLQVLLCDLCDLRACSEVSPAMSVYVILWAGMD